MSMCRRVVWIGMFVALLFSQSMIVRAEDVPFSLWERWFFYSDEPKRPAMALCVTTNGQLRVPAIGLHAENEYGQQWTWTFVHQKEGVYCVLDTHFTRRVDVETIWVKPHPTLQFEKLMIFAVNIDRRGDELDPDPATPWYFIEFNRSIGCFIYSVLGDGDMMSGRLFIGPPARGMLHATRCR